jgi:hypothetical protein
MFVRDDRKAQKKDNGGTTGGIRREKEGRKEGKGELGKW